MESSAQQLNPGQSNSPFSVTKLKYGGYELVLHRDGGNRQHICDFRSEDEAKIWIRENGAKYAGATSEI
ncbi:MAG TPA: hypothetical protein VGF92_07860 [Stellaceae bacterium]|jgi:hypothetical protein